MPRRGTTAQRGYGSLHRRMREILLPLAYGRNCPRCNQVMTPEQKLDLDHDDEDRTKYIGMVHASCNRRHGAIKGNKQRGIRGTRADYVIIDEVVHVEVDDL